MEQRLDLSVSFPRPAPRAARKTARKHRIDWVRAVTWTVLILLDIAFFWALFRWIF